MNKKEDEDYITFDSNNNPQLVKDGIRYEVITKPEIFLAYKKEYAEKICDNPWRKYMSIVPNDLVKWFEIHADYLAKTNLCVVAIDIKSNKPAAFLIGSDFFDDTSEYKKQFTDKLKWKYELYVKPIYDEVVTKYIKETLKLDSTGYINKSSKGAVLNGFEGRKIYQNLLAYQKLVLFFKGYKHLVGESTNAKTQFVETKFGDKIIEKIGEIEFKDYELNGKKFTPPILELAGRPILIPKRHDIRNFCISAYDFEFKPKF